MTKRIDLVTVTVRDSSRSGYLDVAARQVHDDRVPAEQRRRGRLLHRRDASFASGSSDRQYARRFKVSCEEIERLLRNS